MEKNYYDELNLSQDWTVEQLNVELTKLERVWHQREINQPEKAHKVLSLIDNARNVFASTETKKKYDDELNAPEPVDSEDCDSEFRTYFEQAQTFYNANDYDLAKSSIDKALSCMGKTDKAADAYSFAADVYMANGMFDAAITYINNAITANPKEAALYYSKGMVYVKWAGTIASQNIDKISQGKEIVEVDKSLFEKGSKCFESAMNLAHEAGDAVLEGKSAGYMAFCLFRCERPNLAKVREVAERAVSLGDETGEGQSALYQVNTKEKELEEKAKKDNTKQMMLNESIPSTNVYYFDYYAEMYDFNNVKEEGEIIGTCFWETIIKAMSFYGIQFSNVMGGIYRRFQDAANYSKYKYHGFIMYYLAAPGYPQLSSEDKQIQVYLTADDKLVVDFRSSKILAYNTNNELALKILEMGIADGYINENSMVVSEEIFKQEKRKKEMEQREADTKAFYEEIEPERKIIEEKYATIRNNLEQEKARKLTESKEQDARRDYVLQEISSLEAQRKSLGLFDFKKKGKIKEDIDQKSRELASIMSSDKVEGIYRNKLAEINKQEKAEIDSIKARLKKKYPYASV